MKKILFALVILSYVLNGYGQDWKDKERSKFTTDADGNTAVRVKISSDLELGNTPYSIDGGTNGVMIDANNDGTNDLNITSTSIVPVSDDTVSLGSASAEFKDIRIDGTAYIDAISADSATIAGTNERVTFSTYGEYIEQIADGVLQTNGDFKVVGNDIDIGDAGGFSGIKFNAGDTTFDFYIDGTKVGHIDATGAYNDDVE